MDEDKNGLTMHLDLGKRDYRYGRTTRGLEQCGRNTVDHNGRIRTNKRTVLMRIRTGPRLVEQYARR